MPELPEVETVVRTLSPRVVGARIARVEHVRRDMITPDGFDLVKQLTRRRIKNLTRRGKRIVFELDNGNRFFIHLGMSGKLRVQRADAPLAKHTHLILNLRNNLQLRFIDPRRFGEIRWLGRDDDADKTMGPEPLSMKTSDLAKKLTKTTRAIKNALMDQRVIAGLGNIYVDESLFDSRIHPLARADKLKPDQIKRLTASIKRVLKRAILHRGSSLRDYVDARGKRGRFQNLHRVYQRYGKKCSTCDHSIARITLGGRSTHFCPTCQPLRRNSAPTATSNTRSTQAPAARRRSSPSP